MRSVRAALVLLSFVLIAPAQALFAQAATGQVNGTVTDPSGAVITGATVRIINQGTKIASTAVAATVRSVATRVVR